MTSSTPPTPPFDPRRLIPASVRSRWSVTSTARSQAIFAATFLAGLGAGLKTAAAPGSSRASGAAILLLIVGAAIYGIVNAFERRRSDELCDAICRDGTSATGATRAAPEA